MRGLVGIVGLSLLGCDQYASNLPESAVLLGGAYVQPETLELGRKVYIKTVRLAMESRVTGADLHHLD